MERQNNKQLIRDSRTADTRTATISRTGETLAASAWIYTTHILKPDKTSENRMPKWAGTLATEPKTKTNKHENRTKQPPPSLSSRLTPSPAATVPPPMSYLALAFRNRWHSGRSRRLHTVKIKETKNKKI
jgi:hypothetical protein